MSERRPLVAFRGGSFAHRDDAPLFESLNVAIGRHRYALVGPNGAGKTTLLRLIAGEIRLTTGGTFRDAGTRVLLGPTGAAPAVPPLVAAFAVSSAGPQRRLRAELGIGGANADAWERLSPGERQRLALAAALAAEPDLLLLDEPTDHLDTSGRDFAVQALRSFRGGLVVASHDRELLEACTDATLWIESRSVFVYDGGPEAARGARQRDREAQIAARGVAVAKVARLRASFEKAKGVREAADAGRGVRARARGRGDSDARSAMAGNLAEWAERGAARGMKRRERALQDAIQARDAISIQSEKGGDAGIPYTPARRPLLVVMKAGTITVGDPPRALFESPSLVVRARDRIHLAGANGSGKTTLLERLASSMPPSVPAMFLRQQLDAAARDALQRDLDASSPDVRGRTLAIVACLGADPARLRRSVSWSPGEARQLALAAGLARGVSIVLLDEPTNHLDVAAAQRLEAAISQFAGAVVLVSHDALLAARVTETVWSLERGGLVVRAAKCGHER